MNVVEIVNIWSCVILLCYTQCSTCPNVRHHFPIKHMAVSPCSNEDRSHSLPKWSSGALSCKRICYPSLFLLSMLFLVDFWAAPLLLIWKLSANPNFTCWERADPHEKSLGSPSQIQKRCQMHEPLWPFPKVPTEELIFSQRSWSSVNLIHSTRY